MLSLVVPWVRICLLTQGTRALSLSREGPPCYGATTEPELQSLQVEATEAPALEPVPCNKRGSPCSLPLLEAHTQQWPVLCSRRGSPCSLPLLEAHMQQWPVLCSKRSSPCSLPLLEAHMQQ